MKIKKIMQTIHNHNYGGYRKLQKSRQAIFKAIKEYLEIKNNRTAIINHSHELTSDLLYERDYNPSSAVVFDKHGYAYSSTISTIRLTDRNKIEITTLDAGTIYDAESHMSTDDLFNLCDTLESLEKNMPHVLEELTESGEWLERATEILIMTYPEATLEMINEFTTKNWQSLESDDKNIRTFKSIYDSIETSCSGTM